MKIAILSRGAQNHSTRSLTEAALAAGHAPHVLDPFGFCLQIGSRGKRIYYEGVSVEDFDVVLPRLSGATAAYGSEVIAHFEWVAIPVINRAVPVANARNKFRALRILAKHGLPVPPSFTMGSTDFLDQAVAQTSDYPFIMKPFEGTHGDALLLLDTPTSLASAVGAMCDLHQDYIIQPFIRESVGNDFRVFVVGGKVIASMKRIARAGEFRSNIHRGGRGTAVELPRQCVETAIQATAAMELEVAGVDLLYTSDGPLVLEVNPSPGFEEIETVTGARISDAIIAFAVKYAQTQQELACGEGSGNSNP